MDATLTAFVFIGITVFLSLGPALTFLLTPKDLEPKDPPNKGYRIRDTLPVRVKV